jgi:hypothetical protein
MAVKSAALIAVFGVIALLTSCAALNSKIEVHEPDLAHSIRRVVVCPGDIDKRVLSAYPRARQIITQVLVDQVRRQTDWAATVDSSQACHPTPGGSGDAILRYDVKGRVKRVSTTRTETEINIFAIVGLGELLEEVEVTAECDVLRMREISLKLVDVATAQPIAEWRRTSTSDPMVVRLPIWGAKLMTLTRDWMAPGVHALAEVTLAADTRSVRLPATRGLVL